MEHIEPVTMEELHRRIMYLELKLVLLDRARLGEKLPLDWRIQVEGLLDEEIVFLMVADFFENLGTDGGKKLAELIRLQIELMELVPANYLCTKSDSYRDYKDDHPWKHDWCNSLEWVEPPHLAVSKLCRRWEIAEELYSESVIVRPIHHRIASIEVLARGVSAISSYIEGELNRAGFNTSLPFEQIKNERDRCYEFYQEQPLRYGRTTRLLTDAVRWAFLNAGLDGGPGGGLTAIVETGVPSEFAKAQFVNLLEVLFEELTKDGSWMNENNINTNNYGWGEVPQRHVSIYENDIHFDRKVLGRTFDSEFIDHRFEPPEEGSEEEFGEGIDDQSEPEKDAPEEKRIGLDFLIKSAKVVGDKWRAMK